MMKQILSVVVSNDNRNVTVDQTIAAICKAGFKHVFIQWYDEPKYAINQIEQCKLCKDSGLIIDFAHLGYQNINDIWFEGVDGDLLVERYCKNILDLSKIGIHMVVMHCISKWVDFSPNIIGLNRFKKIVEYAKELNVKVAIENTKNYGFLEYLVSNINMDNCGICFDVGHYHCNFKDEWDLSFFKDKVLCVHLHDNDSSSDQHLLPYDGTINWNKTIELLNDLNYDNNITLELCNKNYLETNIYDFYIEGYKRGLRLLDIV